VTVVDVFDMEILRNALDSRDGLLVRQQYLDIPMGGETDWTKRQSSNVACYRIPIRLPLAAAGDKVTPESWEQFADNLHRFLSYAFGHTCLTTPYDDFVFLLSLERRQPDTTPGYASFVLTVHCHITAFVSAFQEWCELFIEGSREAPPSAPRSLPGDQALDIHSQFGKLVPHRINRSGPNRITIQHVEVGPGPLKRPMTTSALLVLLSAVVNSKTLIWDDAERSANLEKVGNMLLCIGDTGRFSWDHISLNRDDPESWEYVG
jgi:hypothetical protein